MDLHPPVALWSQALATDGERQGGLAEINGPGGGMHAALWHGSAASFVDMHPTFYEGINESRILAMAGGAQVGNARSGGTHFAVVWRGTRESAVEMHPTDAYYSEMYGTTGRYHLGRVFFLDGRNVNVLWTADERDTYYDLHSALRAAAGPEWSGVGAYCIALHEGTFYLGGAGVRTDGRQEAMMWVGRMVDVLGPAGGQPCPGIECAADVTGDCAVALDDLTELLAAFGTLAGDPGWNATADLDRDGAVGLGDLARLLAQFGNDCG